MRKTQTVIQRIERPEEYAAFAAQANFNADNLVEHEVDAHFVVLRGDELRARCSLWWRDTANYEKQRSGVIGHFAAHDENSAVQLLNHACRYLQSQNCRFALGPMDGSTWRSYRFVAPDVEGYDEPPFFLEPHQPPQWPDFWRAAGFAPITNYCSQLNTDLNFRDARLERVEQRLQQQNVRIEALNRDRYDAELGAIYDISRVSFRANFLNTPLDESRFRALYEPLRRFVRPELVFIARQETQPVGFLFALPDYQQAQRGEAVDTIIIKTVAVLPGRAFAGLGNLLAARCHSVARELGFTRAIHALMHDANGSRNLSGHYARTIRRYELLGREL